MILIAGVAISWGLVTLFGKSIEIDFALLKQAVRFAGEPLPVQPPSQALQGNDQDWIRADELSPTPQADKDLQEWSRQRAEESHQRQTSFNDGNYRPRPPVNTYTPPAVRQIAATPAPRERQARAVQREHTARWIKSWNGGTNYLAEWVAIDNYIDGTSVCANHRRGSIDYRECRKAAKQHYHEECRAWRVRYSSDRKDQSDRMKTRFCTAASGFNPMG